MNPYLFYKLCTLPMKHAAQVHKTSWYQYHYGAETPKRCFAFSNSRHIGKLNQGQLLGWSQKKKVLKAHGKEKALVVHYDDSNGQRKWKGTGDLRGSELGPHLGNTWFLETRFFLGFGCPFTGCKAMPSNDRFQSTFEFDGQWKEFQWIWKRKNEIHLVWGHDKLPLGLQY